MHERRTLWSGVTAVLLLASAAWGAEKQQTPSSGAQPADWVPVDPTPAAQAQLTLGDGYKLEVKRGGDVRLYSGDLVQATGKWMVLRNSAVSAQVEGVPFLMDIPWIGHWFCRYSEVRVVTDSWIPREAVTLQSHRHGANPAAVNPAVGNEPPARADALVLIEAVAGGKADRHVCELTAVGGDSVTLSNSSDPDHPRIAQRDILCIEVPTANYEPAGRVGGPVRK